jgi:hypothetical protein
MLRLAAVSLLALLALTGCTSPGQASPGSTPTVGSTDTATDPTPDPTDAGSDPRGATYASIEDMRADLETAGVTCPTLVNRDENPNASESGWCEDSMWLLSTFHDIEARNVVLQLNVDSMEPQPFLVGPNWLLASASQYPQEELGQVAGTIGGVYWESPAPFPG